jgi:hypothetical protein
MIPAFEPRPVASRIVNGPMFGRRVLGEFYEHSMSGVRIRFASVTIFQQESENISLGG